ncbi:hypothetical protein MegaChil _gp0999 [Megavirus chiliensis]|uniref:Uncharacterized protein n=3 Tax=Megavirus chilense TaxID=3060301 RepID=L7Y4A8_9VIRU|nr:hypothetical protein MegaChil _gp0999 [Megavirus chiliensis]AGD92972.1 hypothetical protein LBA_01054 [Megavirus lba]
MISRSNIIINNNTIMCYYCHHLRNNVSAPSHRSVNCRDSKNTWSKSHKRNNGQSTRSTSLGRDRSLYEGKPGFFIMFCVKCGHQSYHIMHSNGNELEKPRCMDHT